MGNKIDKKLNLHENIMKQIKAEPITFSVEQILLLNTIFIEYGEI